MARKMLLFFIFLIVGSLIAVSSMCRASYPDAQAIQNIQSRRFLLASGGIRAWTSTPYAETGYHEGYRMRLIHPGKSRSHPYRISR